LTHFMKHQLGEDPKGLADKVRFFCFLNADWWFLRLFWKLKNVPNIIFLELNVL
jgi:hypothetical protein